MTIDPTASPIDYDLGDLTLMPGWIDSHVHITSSFGAAGNNAGMGSATSEAAYRTAANAYATLLAGFTRSRVWTVSWHFVRRVFMAACRRHGSCVDR